MNNLIQLVGIDQVGGYIFFFFFSFIFFFSKSNQIVKERVKETSSEVAAAASPASLLVDLDGSTKVRCRIDATSAQLSAAGKKSALQSGASIFSVSCTTLTFCDTLQFPINSLTSETEWTTSVKRT